MKLLRKLKKTVSFAKWEKGASKFASTYSEQDGWEIEESGYRNISLDAKLRLLKVNFVITCILILNKWLIVHLHGMSRIY